MTLKIGAIPDRKPKKVTALLPPDVHDAFQDYAAIHAQEVGAPAPVGELAGLMIASFLNSDTAFKRARKSLRNSRQSED